MFPCLLSLSLCLCVPCHAVVTIRHRRCSRRRRPRPRPRPPLPPRTSARRPFHVLPVSHAQASHMSQAGIHSPPPPFLLPSPPPLFPPFPLPTRPESPDAPRFDCVALLAVLYLGSAQTLSSFNQASGRCSRFDDNKGTERQTSTCREKLEEALRYEKMCRATRSERAQETCKRSCVDPLVYVPICL